MLLQVKKKESIIKAIVILALLIAFAGCSLDQGTPKPMSYGELKAEVNQVAISSDKESAIKGLVARLPYSAEVRAYQAEAESLNAKLAQTNDELEIQKINADLQILYEKMAADPTYKDTMDNLNAIITPESMDQKKLSESGADGTRAIGGFNLLQRGDIMSVRSGLFDWAMIIYAQWYSHTGNYDGNNQVYESNTNGVRLQPLSNWKVSGQYIGLARNRIKSASTVQSALTWAENRYGTNGSTPYNYFFPDKWTDSRLYCSQLAWKIHSAAGVDLDSNSWSYQLWVASRWGWWAVLAVALPAVAPDEIAQSGNITMYATGWN